MCGIVGFIDPNAQTPHPESVLMKMRESISHRGPDQAGLWSEGPAYLGHRRLAIVDPGPSGQQPFVEDSIVAVANGEIYNHQALRERYAQGKAIPASDCAILPSVYRKEGADVAEVLSGMYAFAIWDANRQTLILGRDPAGQKPLFFAHLPGGGIAFASEIRALLEHPAVKRTLDLGSLRKYLAFDFVPGENTIYEGIERLRPGETVVWKHGNLTRQPRELNHWQSSPIDTLSEASDRLFDTLEQAVKARLMADVPVGVFLSGGLDSTAIVAALGSLGVADSIATFSVGFDDNAFNEAHHARTVAETFGTNHHEHRVCVDTMRDKVPQLLAQLDEPFADPSYIPTRLLSAFAREHVKVVMGGDGGDELFLGYPTFVAEGWVAHAQKLPDVMRRRIIPTILRALPSSSGYMPLAFKGERFLSGLDLTPARRHVTWIGGIDFRNHQHALHPDIYGSTQDHDVMAEVDSIAAQFRQKHPDGPVLNALANQYLATYLAEGVLTKVDRASMTHGLEVRSPFLDRDMVALSGMIPPSLKLQGKTTKHVLRHALTNRVPAHILKLKKRGFALPVARWLREGLRPWMEELLAPESIRQAGIFNPQWVRTIVKEHLSGQHTRHKELWTLLAFETWRTGPCGPG